MDHQPTVVSRLMYAVWSFGVHPPLLVLPVQCSAVLVGSDGRHWYTVNELFRSKNNLLILPNLFCMLFHERCW